MMRRKLVYAIALAGALQAGLAHAVGLGQIELRSALNQPLDAEINLINVGDLDGSQIFVRLASKEDFDRAGVDRDYFLTSIRFDAIIDRRSGQGKVRLRTRDAVREPFLNFVVEARWPNGRVLREYTVLLDLPVTQGVAAAPRTPALQPGVSSTAAATGRPAPAQAVTAARQVTQPAPAAARPAAGRIAEPMGAGQHRIQAGETMWEIARRVRPGEGVSIQQTMLTLQAMNPEAFFNNNINQIKAGYVLRLPTAADVAGFLSQQEALQEVSAQNQAWREGRSRPLPTRTSAPAAAPADSRPAPVEGHLELSATAAAAARQGAGTADGVADQDAGISVVEAEAAREVMVAVERENQELQQNLERMQEQMQTLERLVELKDEQMASLQEAPPAARPQPTAAQPTATESPWLSWLIYIGAGLLALFAVVAFLFSRRNKADADTDIKPVLVARTGVHPVVSATGVAAAQAATEEVEEVAADQAYEAEAPAADAAAEEAAAETATQPSMAPVAAPTEAQTGDAIGEADIYLSLGRYAQAASLLKNALAVDPDNSKLHLKLLSVYVAADDRAAFRAHFETMQGSAGAQTIGRAKELLLGVDDPASWLGERRDTLEMPPVNLAGNDTVVSDAIPDDEALLADDAAPVFGAAAEDTTDTREMGVVELDDTGEFDFSSFGAKEAEQAAVEEDTLDLGNTDDLDFLAETDEASTKLDLARAYIDMGDIDGAREILQEVIQDGDAKARDEARKLLEGL